MYLYLLLFAEAFALDCALLDAEVCAATNQAVDAANAALGDEQLHDAAVSRLQPLTLYNRLLVVADEAATAGCSLEGAIGGAYWADATFGGEWADLNASATGAVAGTIDRSARSFAGSFGGDESGGLGVEFATYEKNGRLASDREAGFHVGVWTRVAGATGVFTTLYGACVEDAQDVFEGWYGPDLETAESGCASGASTFYIDADGDGFGDASLPVELCEATDGVSLVATDCDDTAARVYPGAVELCDDIQNDCDTAWSDDAGRASMVESDVWTDVSATLGAGTLASPVAFDVDGTLQVCEGTWFTNLRLGDDSGVLGVGERDAIILDGAAAGRVITATDDGDAFVEGVVVQNGAVASRGGGVRAQGLDTFTLTNVVVKNNYSADRGGGMHAQGLDTLTVTDVTFSENTDGGSLFGGGANIYDIDDVYLTRVVASGNTGRAGGGLAFYSIHNQVSLDTVSVIDNIAADEGGGISLVGSSVSGVNVLLSGNTSASAGGGIDVFGGTLSLTDSTIIGNNADTGGAFRTKNSAQAFLTNVTVEDNTASTGGAFHVANNTSVSVTDSSLVGNQQTSAGQAVVNLASNNTSFTVVNSSFSGNTDFDVMASSLHAVGDNADFVCDQDGCTFPLLP